MSLNGSNVIDLSQHLARPNLADGLSREELAALLEQLKGLEGRIMARLLLGSRECVNGHPTNGEGADCLVGAKEAAARLSVTADYLYRHADELPFTVRPGPGQVRFSSDGIARYIQQRQGRRKA